MISAPPIVRCLRPPARHSHRSPTLPRRLPLCLPIDREGDHTSCGQSTATLRVSLVMDSAAPRAASGATGSHPSATNAPLRWREQRPPGPSVALVGEWIICRKHSHDISTSVRPRAQCRSPAPSPPTDPSNEHSLTRRRPGVSLSECVVRVVTVLCCRSFSHSGGRRLTGGRSNANVVQGQLGVWVRATRRRPPPPARRRRRCAPRRLQNTSGHVLPRA